MSPLIKNILIAVIAAAVLYFGYSFFFAGDDDLLTAENALVSSEVSRETQQFLVRLQQLRTIELRQDIFTDDRFRSLVDHRQDVVEEPVGRANPFSSIGQ